MRFTAYTLLSVFMVSIALFISAIFLNRMDTTFNTPSHSGFWVQYSSEGTMLGGLSLIGSSIAVLGFVALGVVALIRKCFHRA